MGTCSRTCGDAAWPAHSVDVSASASARWINSKQRMRSCLRSPRSAILNASSSSRRASRRIAAREEEGRRLPRAMADPEAGPPGSGDRLQPDLAFA